MRAMLRSGPTLAVICAAGALAGGERRQPGAEGLNLFQETAVWTVHLEFTPEQWAAMEPAGGAPRGPGAGVPGRPSPGRLLAPALLSGDRNGDGKLTSGELAAVGAKWFAGWIGGQEGLGIEEMKAGVRSILTAIGPGEGPGPGLTAAPGKRNGMSGAAGIDFEYVRANLTFAGVPLKDVAVRYKGNNTFMMARDSIKRSFKIDLNRNVKGQRLVGQTTLNLHNNVTDASWMNEVLSHRLFREAGVAAPRTAYARVFVSVPGQYEKTCFGLYSVVENIDRNFAEDRFGDGDGAIFKPVTRELFEDLGDDWSRYQQTYDPKTRLTGRQQQRVIEFARFVSNAGDREFSAGLSGFLDLDAFARFLSATVWLSNMDSILGVGQNYYVHLDSRDGKFRFLPWDLDHSFGQFPMMEASAETLSIARPWQGRNRFLERVFQVEGFQKLYRARMTELNGRLCRPERMARQVDEIAAAIRPAVAEESSAKLTSFDRAVAGEAGLPGEGRRGPGGMRPIKAFAGLRAASVARQLAGRPEAEKASGLPGGPGAGPGGFGPETMVARLLMEAFDRNRDGKVERGEFTRGFAGWFEAWNTDSDAALTAEEIRAGLDREFFEVARRLGGPGEFGPPGFGPGAPGRRF